MTDDEITISLNLKTLRHLENYIKTLYHTRHVSDGEITESQCLYCLDFLTKIREPIKTLSIQEKIGEIKFERKRLIEQQKKRIERMEKQQREKHKTE